MPMEKFSTFDKTNISHILDVVTPDWSPSQFDMNFRRLYAESIVRHNINSAKFSIQSIDDDKEFLAAAFAEVKDNQSANRTQKTDEWFLQRTNSGRTLTEEQKTAFGMSEAYLNLMDRKTFSYMNEDDIKLSLFVSCSKGAGFPLLERFKIQLKKTGFRTMYLWTDCECNYDWYFRRGFELVEKTVYKPFSGSEPYETFIFRQSLAESLCTDL